MKQDEVCYYTHTHTALDRERKRQRERERCMRDVVIMNEATTL